MKLVRDLIPAIIIESGGTCEWRYTDSKDEYTLLLNDKVQEEVQEYLESSSHEEALEEGEAEALEECAGRTRLFLPGERTK